jgi:hypothetical protein
MLALVALGACGTDARAQTGDGAIDGLSRFTSTWTKRLR